MFPNPMQLFDPGPRREFRWKKETEPTFVYYNQSARPSVVIFREMIEGWFNRFRDEDKKDLRKRFRSPNDHNHLSAFFEIYLHELLSRLGFEVEADPLPERTTHPDFVASTRGSNLFYLEATIAGLPSQEEQ